MDSTLYEDLNIKQDATKVEIKKAFKHKASKHHPDREGGDVDKFKRIQVAYRILSDDDKRKRYDSTGQTNTVPEFKKQALGLLSNTLMQLMEQNGFDHKNYLPDMRVQLANFTATDNANLKKITKAHDAVLYLVENTTGDESLLNALQGQADHMNKQKQQCLDHILLLEEAILVLDTCQYTGDDTTQIYHNIDTGGFTTTAFG